MRTRRSADNADVQGGWAQSRTDYVQATREGVQSQMLFWYHFREEIWEASI